MTCRNCGTDMLKVHSRPAPTPKEYHRRIREVRCPTCKHRAEIEVVERVLRWLAPTKIPAFGQSNILPERATLPPS